MQKCKIIEAFLAGHPWRRILLTLYVLTPGTGILERFVRFCSFYIKLGPLSLSPYISVSTKVLCIAFLGFMSISAGLLFP
jgi:hypothetical protein